MRFWGGSQLRRLETTATLFQTESHMSFPPLDENRKVEKFGRRPYSQGFPTSQIKKIAAGEEGETWGQKHTEEVSFGSPSRLGWHHFHFFEGIKEALFFPHARTTHNSAFLFSNGAGKIPQLPPRPPPKSGCHNSLFPASVLILLLLRPPTLLSRMRPKGGGGGRRRRRERPLLPLFSSLLSLSLSLPPLSLSPDSTAFADDR